MKFRRLALGLLLVSTVLLVLYFSSSRRQRVQNKNDAIVFQPAGHGQPRNIFFAANTMPQTKVNPGRNVTVELPKDSPTSSDPGEQAVAKAKILDTRIETHPDGSVKRTRLVSSSIQPRVLRVEEEWKLDSTRGDWVCWKREMFLADQLIVKVRAEISRKAFEATLANLGMDLGASIAPGLYTVRLRTADMDAMPRALAALSASTDIAEHAEADGVGFGGAIPNDPNFSNQWGVYNTGQSGGTPGADVNAPDFWDVIGNAPGVVVAVLDSGLNFTHPDLQGVWWTNSAEIPGDGIDNDGDGFVDDVRGWDFTNSDNDPTDDHGHGSNVSGIMAANRNNGVGMVGMVNGVKILVCKILNSSNAGTTSALISATTYARQRGVSIMNMSLQNYPFSSTLNAEFDACQSAGILLCICAGNQGVNNDVIPNYPSCYQQTNIIAVGNHDRTDVPLTGSFNPSNYGLTNVDLFAPGTSIMGADLGTGYSLFTGTSQATPFVTAVAAAIKSVNPTWKAPQIKSAILSSVITRPSYNGKCVTGGRLSAIASLASAIRQQPANDTDGDKSPNLLEYLAGTRIDDSASQPVISHDLLSGALHVQMPRVVRSDAHLEVWRSTNLVNWTTTGISDFSTPNLLDEALSTDGGPVGFLQIRAVAAP